MRDRPDQEHPEDLPWNDVPADSDVVVGSEEPDPAEVVGDEGQEVDVSHPEPPMAQDRYRRDSLDERLAEEEPDRALAAADPEAGDIQAAESEQDDLSLDLGEPDQDEDLDHAADQAAEESAIHIVDEGRMRR
ncbi:MAG: hypothetical protein WCB85_01710 [Candidatus Dormiibacterota bacterium]